MIYDGFESKKDNKKIRIKDFSNFGDISWSWLRTTFINIH